MARGRAGVGGMDVDGAEAPEARGGAALMAGADRLSLTSDDERPVAGAGSNQRARGISIASVSTANAYPTPTAASKTNARMEIVNNLIKAEPVAHKACSRRGDQICGAARMGSPYAAPGS